MLVSKYGEREKFLATFNPTYQREIVTSPKICLFGDYPTLAAIKAYGDKTPMAWLIPQLYNLSEYCGCKDKLQGMSLEECAFTIVSEYYFLKISELMLFFHRFKAGKYGRFYGSVDPLVIMEALDEFAKERREWIRRYEREEEERRRVEEEKKNPSMNRDEWLEIKTIIAMYNPNYTMTA